MCAALVNFDENTCFGKTVKRCETEQHMASASYHRRYHMVINVEVFIFKSLALE